MNWVVATPDGDQYVESIAGCPPDGSPVEWIRPAADGRLPAIFQDAVYSFPRPEFVDELIRKYVGRGATLALKVAKNPGEAPPTCLTLRLTSGQRVAVEDLLGQAFVQPALRDAGADGPLLPADGGGRGGADGQIVVGTATPRFGIWRVVEDGNSLGCAIGQEVKPVTVFVGSNGACSPDGKDAVFVEFSDEGQTGFIARVTPGVKTVEPAASAPDARALPVKVGSRGRMRDWRDVVGSCEQEEFSDFPVTGPRSMSWCLSFLRRRHPSRPSPDVRKRVF